MTEIVKGCWVEVLPHADIPPILRGGKPTMGRVEEVVENGDVEVWVPIDGADVDEHSQAVFYGIADLRLERRAEGQDEALRSSPRDDAGPCGEAIGPTGGPPCRHGMSGFCGLC